MKLETLQCIIDIFRGKRRLEFNFLGTFIELIKSKVNKDKIILISACAGIGDYLWSRNYFHCLKAKYPNHKIFLLAKTNIKDFAIYNDSDIFDHMYFLQHPYGATFLEKFFFNFFEFDIFIDNHHTNGTKVLHRSIKAKNIYIRNSIDGVFYRDTEYDFMSTIVDIPSEVKNKFHLKDSNDVNIEKPYVMLVIGSSHEQFSLEQLLEIIEFLRCKTDYKILLSGTKKDLKLYNSIINSVDKSTSARLLNGVNVYKTYQLTNIVKNSKLVITPDSAAQHFCIILNKKCVCVSCNKINSCEFTNPIVNYVLNDELENVMPNWKSYKILSKTQQYSTLKVEKIIHGIEKALQEI